MSRRTALRSAFGTVRMTASISLLNLTEPSPPRPMTNPGRDVFMMTRTAFSLRSISTEVTYAPRKRFLRKRLIAASTQTFWRYFAGAFVVCALRFDFFGDVTFVVFADFAVFADTPSSRNTMLIVLRRVPERPRPKGRARRMTAPLLTVIVFTKRLSTEAPREPALATAA